MVLRDTCVRCGEILADNEKRVCVVCQHARQVEARERWERANPDLVAMSRDKFLKRNPGYNAKKVAEYRVRQKLVPIARILEHWPKGLRRKDVLEVMCFPCLRKVKQLIQHTQEERERTD